MSVDVSAPCWTPAALRELIEYVDSVYVRFGAPERVFGVGPEVDALVDRAMLAGLRLAPVKIRHLGCEYCRRVLEAMRAYLLPRVDIRVDEGVAWTGHDGTRITGVRTASGETLTCRFVICAPGREGAEWLDEPGAADRGWWWRPTPWTWE